MAALPYTATTFDERLKVGITQAGPVITVARAFTKGATARIPGAFGGDMWGSSWPLFALNNNGRLTAEYYNDSKELRGFVQNAAGTGIARTVIAISQLNHQVLGSTVSNPTTGAFVLRLFCSRDDKVTVIAIPADGDMRNVIAYRDIVPVAHV